MDQAIFEGVDSLFNRFWRNLGSWLSEHGFEITVILLIAWLVHRYGARFVTRLLHCTVRPDLYPTKADREKRIKTLDSLISAVGRILVYLVALIMIVSELGVDTTPILASAGVLGVALGFGAQSLIKDLTSGIFIIIDNQYRVGDIVELGNDISGRVEGITIRTTVVRSLDGTLYHVPNGSIDWTANKTMSYGGIEEDIVFPSDVDIEKLTLLINRVGTNLAKDPEWAKKIKDPPHFDRVVGFDRDGIKVKIVGTTGSNDSWDVKGAFYKLLIRELRKAKISIPSMQVMVHNPSD